MELGQVNPGRRRFLGQMAAWGLAGQGLLGGSLLAQEKEGAKEPAAGTAEGQQKSRDRAGLELVTPQTKAAIDRALNFLSRRQVQRGRDKGAFGGNGYAGGVAVCGLSGLAFLGSGSSPGQGPYGEHVDRCVEFLINNTDNRGFISVQAQGGIDRMYGHGFATLFLAEAYGMSTHEDVDDRLGKKLRLAVDLICKTQNSQGGWRYQPEKSDADLSITICQIMALRAARDAGINVPNEVRQKCINYVKKSQNGDGGFRYTLDGGHSSFALTAAGVVALNSAGIYDTAEVEKGLKFLTRNAPNGQINDGYYFYSHYYAAQAMWHAGGTYWSNWYPKIRDTLIKQQRADGSWMDPGVGSEFGAAMGSVILQLPFNTVPVFAEG